MTATMTITRWQIKITYMVKLNGNQIREIFATLSSEQYIILCINIQMKTQKLIMLLFMGNAMSDRRRALKCVSIRNCKVRKVSYNKKKFDFSWQ